MYEMVAILVTKNLAVLRNVQPAFTNIFAKMASLKYGNNKDNYNGEVTHGQPIVKKISYRPYRIIASFSGFFFFFFKEDFLY